MTRVRTSRVVWVLIGVVVLLGLVLGRGGRPTSGSSNDRLYSLAEEMKCLQCVGESVANSQAPIAIQMRAEIGRQLSQGKTDDEIFTYFVDRYGERVLLNPSGRGLVGFVWILPVVVIGVGLVGLGFVFARRRGTVSGGEVSDADRALVERARREQS